MPHIDYTVRNYIHYADTVHSLTNSTDDIEHQSRVTGFCTASTGCHNIAMHKIEASTCQQKKLI